MSFIDLARSLIRRHEGKRSDPYDDATGLTVVPGYTMVGHLSIGIGRNLETGLRSDEIEFLFERDVLTAIGAARAVVGHETFDALDESRRAALVDMAFNLGQTRLGKFAKMLAALREGRFADAAGEIRGTPYATQVGARAEEIAGLIEKGGET